VLVDGGDVTDADVHLGRHQVECCLVSADGAFGTGRG
jgi:hypothetical protein